MSNHVESRFERYADVMVEALGHADQSTPARWYPSFSNVFTQPRRGADPHDHLSDRPEWVDRIGSRFGKAAVG
jgi:hypothetical protein